MRAIFSSALFILIIAMTPNVYAFQSFFDKPKNLKVLPKDISAADLRETMRGFAFALGARCTDCHVSEKPEGATKPIMIFDRDDKENKKIAREMLKLVADINARVTDLGRGDDHVYQKVTCTTCHRGQKKPVLIQTVLDKAIIEGGADEAIKQYGELKERYYGGHTYDFTPFTLAEYAQTVAKSGDLETGVKLAQFNVDNYPDTAYGQQILGQINMELKNYQAAAKAFEAANKIWPNDFTQGLLKQAQDEARKAQK